jgi:hypothetical protein
MICLKFLKQWISLRSMASTPGSSAKRHGNLEPLCVRALAILGRIPAWGMLLAGY